MTDRVIHTPASRATDPVTSHLAEQSISDDGSRHLQRLEVESAVRRFPGMTSAEIAICANLDRHAVGRRLSECVTAGTVRRGDKIPCTRTGHLAMSWWPV